MLAGIALVSLTLLTVILRAGFRYYVLHKVLRYPEARQRIDVPLQKRTLGAQALINPVNLGYATFDVGSNSLVSIEARGNGAVVVATTEDVGVVFMAPFPPQNLTNADTSAASLVAQARADRSQVASYIEGMMTNFIATDVEVEEAHLLPMTQVALMSKDEFLLYALHVAFKGGMRWGRNEVYFFTTPHIRGIVRVGEYSEDRSRGVVELASLDGTKNLGIHILLTNKYSSRDIVHVLDPILGSFQFTADKVDNLDEIKRLISEAGIKQKQVN